MSIVGTEILRPRQNGRNFGADIFKFIFLHRNDYLSLHVARQFGPMAFITRGQFIEILDRGLAGNNQLSESVTTYIADLYKRHRSQ